jgi:hypothetical protein
MIMIEFDVVIPSNNEEEFVAQALILGYKELVFLTDNINYIKTASLTYQKDKILIKTAYLLKDVSEFTRARKRFDYIFAKAERKYFELNVDFIINSELSDRKDSFHYKATSLNQVHAELAKKNNIALVFNFNKLISNPAATKGKMSQNALLIRKYGLDYATFSLATTPSMMRSLAVLHSLENVLGL